MGEYTILVKSCVSESFRGLSLTICLHLRNAFECSAHTLVAKAVAALGHQPGRPRALIEWFLAGLADERLVDNERRHWLSNCSPWLSRVMQLALQIQNILWLFRSFQTTIVVTSDWRTHVLSVRIDSAFGVLTANAVPLARLRDARFRVANVRPHGISVLAFNIPRIVLVHFY